MRYLSGSQLKCGHNSYVKWNKVYLKTLKYTCIGGELCYINGKDMLILYIYNAFSKNNNKKTKDKGQKKKLKKPLQTYSVFSIKKIATSQ